MRQIAKIRRETSRKRRSTSTKRPRCSPKRSPARRRCGPWRQRSRRCGARDTPGRRCRAPDEVRDQHRARLADELLSRRPPRHRWGHQACVPCGQRPTAAGGSEQGRPAKALVVAPAHGARQAEVEARRRPARRQEVEPTRAAGSHPGMRRATEAWPGPPLLARRTRAKSRRGKPRVRVTGPGDASLLPEGDQTRAHAGAQLLSGPSRRARSSGWHARPAHHPQVHTEPRSSRYLRGDRLTRHECAVVVEQQEAFGVDINPSADVHREGE